jgi:hypothetical protein
VQVPGGALLVIRLATTPPKAEHLTMSFDKQKIHVSFDYIADKGELNTHIEELGSSAREFVLSIEE